MICVILFEGVYNFCYFYDYEGLDGVCVWIGLYCLGYFLCLFEVDWDFFKFLGIVVVVELCWFCECKLELFNWDVVLVLWVIDLDYDDYVELLYF